MQAKYFAEGEYYHVYTRGVRKQEIFHDERDYVRFVFLLLHFQGDYVPTNITKNVNRFIRTKSFGTSEETTRKIIVSKMVSLNFFSLMPNHVHIALEEVKESGVSRYMQRALTAYAKYYNEKYKVTGHLFQSKFGRVLVEDNDQLLHLSAYIHRNQRDLMSWRDRESQYPWSSYVDYIDENRWGDLLATSTLLDQFENKKDYGKFAVRAPAKAPEVIGMEV